MAGGCWGYKDSGKYLRERERERERERF